MTDENFLKLKAGMLCYGLKLTDSAKKSLEALHPEYFDKGFIDAMNINLNGSNICVSIAEDFSGHSGFTMDTEGDSFFITFKEEKVPVRFFAPLPVTDTVVDSIARLHADGCLNIWPSTTCCYDKKDIKCKFCSLVDKNGKPLDIDTLCEGIKKILEKEPWHTLNFSGGTYRDPDTMVKYWCDLAKKIRTFSDCPIAVEFAPPKDLGLLTELKESGVSAAIMNIEIVDPELRRKICPGKSGISIGHYHKALKKGVEVFGYGQVSSVMIGGLQPWDDILSECEYLCSIGVFPTIMPFRPLDDCDLADVPSCDHKELIKASLKLGAMLRKYKLDPAAQPGCTRCGGCSIENDCYKALG